MSNLEQMTEIDRVLNFKSTKVQIFISTILLWVYFCLTTHSARLNRLAA